MEYPIDASRFRRVLGRYPTGVSLVASRGADGKPISMVIGSFASVSLEPPLVSFMPACTSTTWPLIEQAGHFSVNVLSVQQEAVCRSFRGDPAARFAGEPWREVATGSPILDRAVAWVDCEIESRVEAGDHFIVIGKVVALDSETADLPMLFFQGGYGSFTPDTMVTTDSELSTHLAFIDRARPLMESVARAHGGECVLGTISGAEMLLLASAGNRTDSRLSPLVGERIRVTAPFGRSVMAWASENRVAEWMGRGDTERREDLKKILGIVRERGYSITVEAPAASVPGDATPLSLLDPGVEFDPEHHPSDRMVQSITAPIYGRERQPDFLIGLFGLSFAPSDSVVTEVARSLQEVAADLGRSLSALTPLAV